MAPHYVMCLDSSPNCCTALLLTSFFSTILFLYLPLLVHLCAQIFSISDCYPTPSFFPALTFFPLFLFIAPLFYNFLPRLYFCHFLSLFSPISTTCLSFSSSLFLFLIDLTSLSLPLFPFSLMISLTTLNFLWFHLCAISGLASGNWRFYVTMLWCSWFYKVRTLGLFPAHLEHHVMDFRQCLILWSVLSFLSAGHWPSRGMLSPGRSR